MTMDNNVVQNVPGYAPPQAPPVSHSPIGVDEKQGERQIDGQVHDGPVTMYCPLCKSQVNIKVDKQLTSDGKTMAILGCCFFTPLMCYVMLSDKYKEGVYHCVNCNTEVGKFALQADPILKL